MCYCAIIICLVVLSKGQNSLGLGIVQTHAPRNLKSKFKMRYVDMTKRHQEQKRTNNTC